MGLISKVSVLLGVMAVLGGIIFGVVSVYEVEVAEWVFLTMLTKLSFGKLCLHHPNGQKYLNGVLVPPAEVKNLKCEFNMIVHDRTAFAEFIFSGFTLGFGEAYMNGKWDIGKGEDLSDIPMLLSDNVIRNPPRIAVLLNFYSPRVLYQEFLYKFNLAKSDEQEAKNVQHHYDLGNDFYGAMLDETMTYSCAIWSKNTTDLKDAQLNKVRVLDDKLDIQPGDRLLDIGSGWGWLINHFAQKYASDGIEVHGITLAHRQYEYSTAKYKDVKNMHIHLRHYDEYLKPQYKQFFTKVVSVGMVSHVHIQRIQDFMNAIAHATKPGGKVVLHYVAQSDVAYSFKPLYRETACDLIGTNFIGKYAFPGICVLHPDWVQEAGIKAGLTMIHKESFGYHYAKTLYLWRKNLNKNWHKIKDNSNYDDRLRKMYEWYMMQSEAAFKMQRLDLAHQTFIRDADSPVDHVKNFDYNEVYVAY